MAITRTRYSTVAIGLHWLIAGAIVFQIVLGWRMGGDADASTFAVFQLHKSIGVTILFLSLARLGWRIAVPAPAPPDQPRWEKTAARLTHIAFYVIMIGLPVTGWILISASRINIPTLLFGVIPWPHLPVLPGLEAGAKASWEAFGEASHSTLVYLTYLLLALHIGAILKHQWLDRDTSVLSRMTGGGRPGLAEPRLLLIAASLTACVLAGFLYASTPSGSIPTAVMIEPAAEGDVSMNAPDLDVMDSVEPAPTAEETAQAPTEAAPTPPPEPAAQPLARWTVRRDEARLGFTTQWSGAPVEGRFRNWDAEIVFSPDRLEESRISVSVDTGSAETGDAQRDSTLPGVDFFDTSKHPAAVFASTRIRRTGEGRYVADGVLTLRGVRSPLSLPFQLQIESDTARARGGIDLDRILFGVGQGAYAPTESIPALVRVHFELTAERTSLQ